MWSLPLNLSKQVRSRTVQAKLTDSPAFLSRRRAKHSVDSSIDIIDYVYGVYNIYE